MSFAAVARFLQRRSLSRSFATTSACQNEPPLEIRRYIPRKRRTPKVDPQTQSLLPPHKLRALVSLYHQSEDFIKEEDLLSHIDAVFLGGEAPRRNSINQFDNKGFQEVLKSQRAAPRIAPWYHENTSPTWNEQRSGQMHSRESQIIDALYGVDSGSLPGYETLMEAKKVKKE